MIKFIVKLQLSLTTTENQQQCLVYNQKRNLLQQFDATPEILRIMEGRVKRYFNATFDKGELAIKDPVKDQLW